VLEFYDLSTCLLASVTYPLSVRRYAEPAVVLLAITLRRSCGSV
jgi:hypothetical protein